MHIRRTAADDLAILAPALDPTIETCGALFHNLGAGRHGVADSGRNREFKRNLAQTHPWTAERSQRSMGEATNRQLEDQPLADFARRRMDAIDVERMHV